MTDEIIEEVRAVKTALAEASGFDIRRIALAIKQSEIQNAAEGWQHIPAPIAPPSGSAIRRTRFARL